MVEVSYLYTYCKAREMIKRLRVKNFKALRDIEIELTPIHVLIGPNDTGKTSILDVLAALCRSVDHDLKNAFLGSWKGTELVWGGKSNIPVTVEVDFDDTIVKGYGINLSFREYARARATQGEFLKGQKSTATFGMMSDCTWVEYQQTNPEWSDPQSENLRRVQELLSGVHYYRFDSLFLALPVAPDSKRRFRMESNGFGLALCLDEILSFDRDLFIKLEDRFKKIFPCVKSIKLMQEEAYQAPVDDPKKVTMLRRADGKGLYFEMQESSQLIPASQVSDGILLVLAYLAILHLPEPPRLLLIEEPENGIHPKRLRDILEILRNLVHEQSHTQVVLTTHSPYVLDLFKPEEVTLCTKLDTGEIKTTRLSDSPAVMEQLNVFTLGEVWTSEGDEKIAKSKDEAKRAMK
jgi:predicted ATPase